MTGSHSSGRRSTGKGNAWAAAKILSEPPLITFSVYEDNVGGHHWTLVAASGETVASSVGFASKGEAEAAARSLRTAAASASIDPSGGAELRADLHAGRTESGVRDDLDAERWLDEGGSFRTS